MWWKPGLKTTWNKQTSVSPFLLEKPEVGRGSETISFTNQLAPKIGLSLSR